jgi:hypothetical protein
VSDLRRRTRLTVDGEGGRHQVLLPIAWAHDQADLIRGTVLAVHAARSEGLPIERAVAIALTPVEPAEGPGVGPMDGPDLVERFKARKLSRGSIKPQTWASVYQRRMDELLAAMATTSPPTCPRELLEALTSRWADQPGSRGRQMQTVLTTLLSGPRHALVDERPCCDSKSSAGFAAEGFPRCLIGAVPLCSQTSGEKVGWGARAITPFPAQEATDHSHLARQ